MKRFCLIVLFAALSVSAGARIWQPGEVPNVQLADRSRYVSNPDGILSDGAVATIDSLCRSLREQGIAQVAVAALDDIEGGDTFDFAMRLFGGWGVGRSDADNGLGVLLVRDLREIRFITGPGIEGVLPDALCKRIQLNFMLPHFRDGDYDAGMVAGMRAVAELLEGGELDFGPEPEDKGIPWLSIVLGPLGFFFCVVLFLAFFGQSRRCPRCGKRTLNLTDTRVLSVASAYELVEHTYVCASCGKEVKRMVRNFRDNGGSGGSFGGGSFGGGSFGGGSFGGGFLGGGSFGGGSFGGGGAGSKW